MQDRSTFQPPSASAARGFDRPVQGSIKGLGMARSSIRATILLVDDDPNSAVPLIFGLQEQGFRALHAVDGHWGLKLARTAQPDLVLLDAMLPQMDGFAVCRTLRGESAVPIIMLTACGKEGDGIKSLEIGADDYIIKPVSFRELLARVQAILRRCKPDGGHISPLSSRIAVGDIVLDSAARQVQRGGRLIKLRRREFDLLCALMENAGQAVSRDELLDRVWGEDWIGDPRTVDVHVCWLRRKLEVDSSTPRHIQTVYGYGYRFVDPALRQAHDIAALPAVAA